MRAGDKPQVLACAESVNPGAESEAEALRGLVSQVDRSLPVLMTLSRSQYRLRVMPEPVVPHRELLASVRWALSTDSELPPDEFDLAWLPIPQPPAHENVLSRTKQGYAVMTAKSWLASRLALWKQGGVKPKVVDVRETALRNLAGALERPGEGLALISADSDGVGMVFTHQGSLYLDRFIEQPLAELRAADAATRARLHERIALQLLRSVDVVGRSYPFMPVTRVLVAPAAEDLGLLDFLAAQVPLAVVPLDLAQVFDLTRVPALGRQPALQARCLVALGAALRSAKASAA